ncbi:MAG: TlpA family protein disulfide reductase [Armatimonadetes bacterium]|nr:TlpA family protein disulfide reductase [Armatimonadota bacterium]
MTYRWAAIIAGVVLLGAGVVLLIPMAQRSKTPPLPAPSPGAVPVAPVPVPAPPSPLSPAPTTPGPAREGVRVGNLAPDFALSSVANPGRKVRLSDFRGQVVVLNFWASWCVPCRSEAKDFVQAHQKYRSRGVVILGVDIVQDTWEDAAAFIKEHGVIYPTVRDDTGEVTTRYQIVGLPTTYFIDRQGVIRDRFVGGFLGDLGRKELIKRIEARL